MFCSPVLGHEQWGRLVDQPDSRQYPETPQVGVIMTVASIVLKSSGLWQVTLTADLMAALFLVFWIGARTWERRFGEIFGFRWYQARNYSILGALVTAVLLTATGIVALI